MSKKQKKAKTKKKAKTYAVAIWDWKEDFPLDVLEELGLHVYDIAWCKGTDTNGVLISKDRLNDHQITQIEKDEGLIFDDDDE